MYLNFSLLSRAKKSFHKHLRASSHQEREESILNDENAHLNDANGSAIPMVDLTPKSSPTSSNDVSEKTVVKILKNPNIFSKCM